MRIRDWSSDVCSSDLIVPGSPEAHGAAARRLEVTVDKAVAGKNLAARAHQQGDAGLAPGHRALQQNLTVTAERRSEEHTSELQSLMRISYAVFCLKKTTKRLRAEQRRT